MSYFIYCDLSMNSSDDLVSIIIPVYNSEQFLRESIMSLLNQTYSNLEIIVIDDGSTDNSPEILKSFSDQIKIISQSNSGLGSALNKGLNNMTGKWFKWFSPDDVLYPDTIQILVDASKQLPDNTIIYSNWDLIDENNKKLRIFTESNYNDLDSFDFNVRLLDNQLINVNTTLIPYSLFTNGCFFQESNDPVITDYDFFLRAGILFNTKFHLISKSLIGYRVSSNQLSRKSILKTFEFLSVMRNQILSKLENHKREKYLIALKKLEKNKPLSKKTMELGLEFMKPFPKWITDPLLIFYLNKIRSTR